MKIRAPLALLALTALGCGGHHHSSSSSSPAKETTVRTVAAISYVFDISGNSTNYVVTFKTTDVKTLITKVAVTGLDKVVDPTGKSGPDILEAIDQRPATGKLYAISGTGILYTIDPATGVATRVAAVPAVQALLPNNFGIDDIDFDPVADQLRVIVSNSSDDAANLRINADTGALVAKDISINRNGKSLAPYMNGIAYTPTGTLFALANSDEQPSLSYENLLRIPDPSSGGVRDFTTLPTVYFDGVDGFDIASDGTTGVFIDADDQEVFLIDIATGAPRSIGFLPEALNASSVAFLKPTS